MKHLTKKSDSKRRANEVEPHIVAAESASLLAIWNAFSERMKAAGTPVSQAEFGAEHDLGSQGMVWQYLNGTKPLGLDAAEKFARGLGCKITDFSPRLAARVMSAAEIADGHKAVPLAWSTEMHELLERALRAAGHGNEGRIRALLELIVGEAVSDEEVQRRMPITRSAPTGK